MPFDKPRLFSGDGAPETGMDTNTKTNAEFTAKARSTLRPKASLLHEAVPDEELGLSAELQVLASHLRGEADSLAERYAPATSPTSPSGRDRRLMRRWVWQSMAVGVAGLAFLAWKIDRWQQGPPAENVAQVVAPQQKSVRVVAADPVASVPLNLPAVPATPSSNAATADAAAIRHTQGIAEVGIDGPAIERHPPADQVEMLRIQVLGFEKVIRRLQAELVARDAAQIESQRQIQSLQEEVLELHKQLDDHRR